MRIVQIIDSLEAGGAEKMAVNYANALSHKIDFSGIIATRKEGLLLDHIEKEVSYLFLKRNRSFDLKSVFRLRKYLVKNKVEVIHAHSSSFFISILVKLTLPKIYIIWHDHYGISQDLLSRKNLILKFGSFFFKGIISVNMALKNWAESYLFCPNIVYLSNFITESSSPNQEVLLSGSEGKRIICLANLRPQKNHKLLLEAARDIHFKFPDWSFHLVGKDFNDLYSSNLRKMVEDMKLQRFVFFYGSVYNVDSVLKQSNIAVLTSFSEGLPLAVLEYGLYSLPVIATNVGEISRVITCKKEGIIIESDNKNQLLDSLQYLIENEDKRKEMGMQLNKRIILNYSTESIMQEYVLWLKTLINFTN